MSDIPTEEEFDFDEDTEDHDESIHDANADESIDIDESDPLEPKEQLLRNLKAAGINIEEVDE